MKKILFLILLVSITAFAQSDRYYYQSKMLKTAIGAGDRSVIEYRVLDITGKLRYSITRSLDYDMPHPVLKSWDDGGAVLMNSCEGSVEFFNNDGISYRRVVLGGHPSSPYEQSLFGSPSGDRLALCLSHPADTRSSLTILDRAGNTLQQRDIDLSGISMLVYDDRSDRTALSGMVWMRDSMVFRTIVLHPFPYTETEFSCHLIGGFFDHHSRLWGWNKKSAFRLSPDEDDSAGRLPLEVYRVPDTEIILDMVRDTDGICLLTSHCPSYRDGAWQYDHLRVIKLDGQATMVASHDITPISSIRISLLQLDGKLFVRTDQGHLAIPSF